MGSLCALRSFSPSRSSFASLCSSLFRSFTTLRAREFAATPLRSIPYLPNSFFASLPLELDPSHNITKIRDTFRPSDPFPTLKLTKICLILLFSFRSIRKVSSRSCAFPLSPPSMLDPRLLLLCPTSLSQPSVLWERHNYVHVTLILRGSFRVLVIGSSPFLSYTAVHRCSRSKKLCRRTQDRGARPRFSSTMMGYSCSSLKSARNGSLFTPIIISAGSHVLRIRTSRMGSSGRAGSRRRLI